ncbi:MAG: hypothetical protein ACLP5E_16540 [Streptosporangiaceae bacterium]
MGNLVGWGYTMITGLVGPIVNLLIGYFVGTILNTEFGWNFKAMWITFMLVSAALTALLGYRGVKLGTRFGVVLGAFEIVVFVALSIWMIVKAGSSAQTLSVFTLKFLTAVMLCIYIVINISTIGYYLRKARDEFNLVLHLVLPAVGAVILIPVLAAAAGVGSSVLKFVSPLPYPISDAGLVVGIWFLIGIIYLAYLLRRHPERVRDMDKVFD